MTRPLMPATLVLLATIFVASCSSAPHGDTTYASTGNSAYAAPAAPIYQPLVYPALASQPQRMVIPAPPPFPQQPQPSAPSVFASASNVGSQAPAINAASYILVDARSGDVIAARN